MTLTYSGFTNATCPECDGLSIERRGRCPACKGTGTEFVTVAPIAGGPAFIRAMDRLAQDIHNIDNIKWWRDLTTGEDMLQTRDRGDLLMLVVTELDEAADAMRANLNDDKLPHRPGYDVELADAAIRLFDMIGAEQRRGGQAPLITFIPELGNASVWSELNYLDQNIARCRETQLMWIIGALSKALDQGFRREKFRVARFWLTVALFRIIAVSIHNEVPLFDCIEEKRKFNSNRADHKPENRRAEGGKKS